MCIVREEAKKLRSENHIQITQKGNPVEGDFTGPIRLLLVDDKDNSATHSRCMKDPVRDKSTESIQQITAQSDDRTEIGTAVEEVPPSKHGNLSPGESRYSRKRFRPQQESRNDTLECKNAKASRNVPPTSE